MSADLLNACALGDEVAVRHLLRQGADIDATDSDGDGVLRYAIGSKNLALFEFLLDSGVSASTTSTSRSGEAGHKIIHAVAASEWADALQLLLVRGADPDARAFSGYRPLMGAAASGSVSSVEMLAAAGADLDAMDGDGDTALYYAASRGQLDAVVALCELGATVDVLPNNDGHTPFSYAAALSAYRSFASRETQESCLRIARYLALEGASARPMYGHGYVFIRSGAGRDETVPLYDFARAVRVYDDLEVSWTDRRAAGAEWMFSEQRPTR